ncbi:MAG: ClpXP protease specificity-enhancing factor [Macromonas sp.]
MSFDDDTPSTRPYLIRALHEWCTDHGFTPYLVVHVDDTVQVPREFVQNNEIVLNTSYDATSHLRIANDYVEFKARFGGIARDILVPIDHVVAIYARENGQGMAFTPPVPSEALEAASRQRAGSGRKGLQVVAGSGDAADATSVPAKKDASAAENAENPPTKPSSGRPTLTRVK